MAPHRGPADSQAGRVYRSAQPMRQLRFPERSKSVKVYGNGVGRRVPPMTLQKQETLTQMDFLQMGLGEFAEHESDDEGQEQFAVMREKPEDTGRDKMERGEATSEKDPVEGGRSGPRRSVRRTSTSIPLQGSLHRTEVADCLLRDHPLGEISHGTKRLGSSKSSKRRKISRSVSVKVDGRECGDINTTSSPAKSGRSKKGRISQERSSTVLKRSEYHTQTITQLDWALVPSSQDEVQSSGKHQGLARPSSLPALQESKSTESHSQSTSLALQSVLESRDALVAESHELSKSSLSTIRLPQTPKRLSMREIPSSESPATPAFLRSGDVTGRSALPQNCIDTPIPFKPDPPCCDSPSPYRLPKLVIEDTFETGTEIGQVAATLSTPTKKSSPFKSVRFAIPPRSMSPSPSSTHNLQKMLSSQSEIQDSDAESEDDHLDDKDSDMGERDELVLELETYYDGFGDETQLQAEALVNAEKHKSIDVSGSNGSRTRRDVQHATLDSSLHSTAVLPPHENSPVEDLGHGYSYYENKTQYTESQRLHTQHLKSFAPRTLSSDLFVSLPAQQMMDFITRKRTHDIRAFAYPIGTSRLWIYVLKPVCRLTYMAVISSAKRPGEVSDDNGVGNRAFNMKGKESTWHAYEIDELYELADPLSLEELVDNEWLEYAPKKYEVVRPAVIDGLIANLMPPVFRRWDGGESDNRRDDGEDIEDPLPDQESQEHRSSSANDTQEVTDQLLSNLRQYTQQDSLLIQPHRLQSYILRAKESRSDEDHEAEVIPSSQDENMLPPLHYSNGHVHGQSAGELSQASTVDLTQTQKPFSVSTPHKQHLKLTLFDHAGTGHDVVRESPTRPVRSSSLRLGPTESHSPDLNHIERTADSSLAETGRGNESTRDIDSSIVIPYSIPSSQMLTKSQMDREIVFDSIPLPPVTGYGGDMDEDDEL